MGTLLAMFRAIARRKVGTESSRWSSAIGNSVVSALIFGVLNCAPQEASAQFIQQGNKLSGGDVITAAQQGQSVALSGSTDGGNTAIVGGPGDNSGIGAAWVYTRTAGIWSQQGSKLIGAGAVGAAGQGGSVALSADGNTAVVGGPNDNSGLGAVWVFARSNGTWTQQAELVATDAVGAAGQGTSVALSADGNTAIVGGPGDNGIGAAWVFTRSGGVWIQQGGKLVGAGPLSNQAFNAQGFSVALSADGNTAIIGGPGTFHFNPPEDGPIGAAWVFTRTDGVWTQQGSPLFGVSTVCAYQGFSVALSADGTTAIVGGPGDDGCLYENGIGAAWVFTQNGGVWTQQGPKLVGVLQACTYQGFSVALSADGNTAIMGGPGDHACQTTPPQGAAWIFTRTDGVWAQQGLNLVGTSAAGNAEQGYSVSLSADGNTAIVGGPGDNGSTGAAWTFVRVDPTNTHDFNGDGISDILWRDTGGNIALWLMNGGEVVQGGVVATVPTAWSIIGQHDFNGDGIADLLWRDSGGNLALWLMNGLTVSSGIGLGNVSANWTLYGTADLNGDGMGDLLWRDSNTGVVAVWFMNGAQVTGTASLGAVPNSWSIVGEDNGIIFWRDTAGDIAIWQVVLGSLSGSAFLGNVPPNWQVAGVGDFNGDGNTDILWRDTSGEVAMWFLNSTLGVQSAASLGNVPTSWGIAQVGDYNGDGKSDILWIDNSANVAIWFMNGGTVSSSAGLGNVGISWQVQSANPE